MENDIKAQISLAEKNIAEDFANLMLLVSADAENCVKNGTSLFNSKEEEENLSNLLKQTDSFLRPYMEEFFGTIYCLERAFRSEIANSIDD